MRFKLKGKLILACVLCWLGLDACARVQEGDRVDGWLESGSSQTKGSTEGDSMYINKVLASDPNTTSPPFTTPYKRIATSSQYYSLFASHLSKISLSQTVDATPLSNGKEICADSQPCKFYYFVIKPKFDPEELSSFDISRNNNVRNVFVVAGMHGNEYLGPTALLYAVGELETPGTRVIVFPLANPSGYDHNTRTVHPTNVDPNRDFPIEQYKKCYQTSSSLIIDHIYRKYHIDLTVALHNGQSEIAWTWGTNRQKADSHTRDEPIYRDIGEWLKFIGGQNKKLKMEEFRIGTMNEVVYPVEGGFEDWAYAASWYNASVSTAPSRSCNYLKFPYNMTNGLVFLFELGPFKVDQAEFGSEMGLKVHPNSRNSSNGYVSRAIRMLSGIVKIPNPRLDIKFTKNKMIFKLNGCKKGFVEGLKIIRKKDNQTYLELKTKTELEGNMNNRTVQPSVIRLEKQLMDGYSPETSFDTERTLVVQYRLSCDAEWQGKGETVFGQKRQFNIKESIVLTPIKTDFLEQNYFRSTEEAVQSFGFLQDQQAESQAGKFEEFIEDNSEVLVVVLILLVVLGTVLFVIYVICREIKKDRKERKMKKLMKRLQKVNSEGQASTMSDEDMAENTFQQIKLPKRQQKKQMEAKNKIDSYPYMCESDKSMKTDELNCEGEVKI